MIVCPNCSKENQDHYKFCLGCGAKLPPPGQAPAPPPQPAAPAVPPPQPGGGHQPPAPAQAPPQQQPAHQAPPPPQGAPPQQAPYSGQAQAYGQPPPQQPGPYGQPQQGTYGQPPPQPYQGGQPQPYQGQQPYQGSGQPAQAPPPSGPGQGVPPPMPGAAPAAGGPMTCPNCQTPNPPQFKFCGACGTPLGDAAQAPAPPPPSPGSGPGQPAQAAPPPGGEPAQAKTMFMDASQRPDVTAASDAPSVRLVLLREDGTEGGVLVIEGGPDTIGRSHGPPFDEDAYLDPSHAALTATPEGLIIDDLDSLNGVYLKLEGRCELRDRDFFRVGQELLLYEDLPEPATTPDGTERMGSPNPGYWGRVSVMVSQDRACSAFPIREEGVTIGREDGDITFPDDGYVSGTHCTVAGDDDGVFLEDLGSSNGTYMRVRKNEVVTPGNLILIGQQLFRVDPG